MGGWSGIISILPPWGLELPKLPLAKNNPFGLWVYFEKKEKTCNIRIGPTFLSETLFFKFSVTTGSDDGVALAWERPSC